MVGCCQNSTGETGRASNSDSSPDSTTASRDATPRSFSESIEVDVVGTAANIGDQVVHQPVSQFGLIERRHAGVSSRMNSSWR